MPRHRKDARILHIKLDRRLYELLEKQSKATGNTRTGLLEKILSEHFLNAGGSNPESSSLSETGRREGSGNV